MEELILGDLYKFTYHNYEGGSSFYGFYTALVGQGNREWYVIDVIDGTIEMRDYEVAEAKHCGGPDLCTKELTKLKDLAHLLSTDYGSKISWDKKRGGYDLTVWYYD